MTNGKKTLMKWYEYLPFNSSLIFDELSEQDKKIRNLVFWGMFGFIVCLTVFLAMIFPLEIVLFLYVLIFIYNWVYYGEKSLNSLKYDDDKKKKDIRLLKVTKWLSAIIIIVIILGSLIKLLSGLGSISSYVGLLGL